MLMQGKQQQGYPLARMKHDLDCHRRSANPGTLSGFAVPEPPSCTSRCPPLARAYCDYMLYPCTQSMRHGQNAMIVLAEPVSCRSGISACQDMPALSISASIRATGTACSNCARFGAQDREIEDVHCNQSVDHHEISCSARYAPSKHQATLVGVQPGLTL